MNDASDGGEHQSCDIHLPFMELRRKGFEVVRCSKALVELGHIRGPVAMVWIAVGSRRALVILIYRTDPNWRGPETLQKFKGLELTY